MILWSAVAVIAIVLLWIVFHDDGDEAVTADQLEAAIDDLFRRYP